MNTCLLHRVPESCWSLLTKSFVLFLPRYGGAAQANFSDTNVFFRWKQIAGFFVPGVLTGWVRWWQLNIAM
jgi:hypothetical protein